MEIERPNSQTQRLQDLTNPFGTVTDDDIQNFRNNRNEINTLVTVGPSKEHQPDSLPPNQLHHLFPVAGSYTSIHINHYEPQYLNYKNTNAVKNEGNEINFLNKDFSYDFEKNMQDDSFNDNDNKDNVELETGYNIDNDNVELETGYNIDNNLIDNLNNDDDPLSLLNDLNFLRWLQKEIHDTTKNDWIEAAFKNDWIEAALKNESEDEQKKIDTVETDNGNAKKSNKETLNDAITGAIGFLEQKLTIEDETVWKTIESVNQHLSLTESGGQYQLKFGKNSDLVIYNPDTNTPFPVDGGILRRHDSPNDMRFTEQATMNRLKEIGHLTNFFHFTKNLIKILGSSLDEERRITDAYENEICTIYYDNIQNIDEEIKKSLIHDLTSLHVWAGAKLLALQYKHELSDDDDDDKPPTTSGSEHKSDNTSCCTNWSWVKCGYVYRVILLFSLSLSIYAFLAIDQKVPFLFKSLPGLYAIAIIALVVSLLSCCCNCIIKKKVQKAALEKMTKFIKDDQVDNRFRF